MYCGGGLFLVVSLEFSFVLLLVEGRRVFVISAYECVSAVTRGSSAPGRQMDLFPVEGTDQVRQSAPLGSSRAWACWSPRPWLALEAPSPGLPIGATALTVLPTPVPRLNTQTHRLPAIASFRSLFKQKVTDVCVKNIPSSRVRHNSPSLTCLSLRSLSPLPLFPATSHLPRGNHYCHFPIKGFSL